jgi:hypothetical protein
MKREEIEKMTGRELDVAVAEQVMGLVPCQSKCHEPGAKLYMARPCHALPESPDQGGETALYSSEIADAWRVVEKLIETWDIVDVWHEHGHDSEAGLWYCELAGNGKGETAYATSPQVAICRAALLAVAETEKE